MPYWIFVYIIITIPIGQALMRGLKYFEFSRKLKAEGKSIFGEMIDFVEETVEEEVRGEESEEEEEEEKPKRKKGGKGKKPDKGKKPRKAPKLRVGAGDLHPVGKGLGRPGIQSTTRHWLPQHL